MGLSTNTLKIIALITMVIDHIGLYFQQYVSPEIYIILRIIGRISMPIFVFVLVEGFIHTSSLKKYKRRILIIAIVTEITLRLLNYINIIAFTGKLNVSFNYFNILFSFYLSLALLDVIVNEKEHIIKLLYIILIIGLYYFIDIDYGILIPILAIIYYIVYKISKKFDNNKCNINGCNTFFKISIFISIILVSAFQIAIQKYMIIASVIIMLYNGKKGLKTNNRFLQKMYYYIFPIHHFLIYMIALFI